MTARRPQQGFSLLELIVVVVLVGLLAAFGIRYYLDALDRAHATTVEITAWRFGQTAATLRAWQRIPLGIESHRHGVDERGVRWVDVEGTRIFLTDDGWPANTDPQMLPVAGKQTQKACTQLLDAILGYPTDNVRSVAKKVSDDFQVFAVDGDICRYQLVRSREDAWYFDYNVNTGRVQISVPNLRMEKYAKS